MTQTLVTRHDYAATHMQFTITEAAKLYGKQRKTLYRHIGSGRISASMRGDGKRVLDLSELIRCYGEPSQALPASDTKLTHQDSASDTLMNQALLEEIRRQTAVIERMSERIERLEQALLTLPAPPHQKVEHDSSPASPDFKTRHQFSDLIDAIRKNEG